MRDCSICCQVFVEVGEDIALGLELGDAIGITAGSDGIDTRGMIHEIGSEAASFDFLRLQIPCELIEDSGYHLYVGEFFRSDVGQDARDLGIGHGDSLSEVAKRGTNFSVGSTELTDDDLCVFRVGVFDLNGIL